MIRELLPLFEILAYLYCFAATFGKKMKYNIYGVVFIISEMILMIGINDYGFPRYLISLSYVLMVMYCMLNYQLSLKETIVNCTVSIVVIGLVQIIGYFILTTLFRKDDRNSLTWEVIIMTFCFLISWLVAPHLKIDKLSRFLLRKNKLLGIIGGFVLLALGSQIYFMKKNGYVNGREYILFVYFILIVLVLIVEWQKSRINAEKEKTQLEMNALYYSAYEELIRSVREKQHDFKNHMNAIKGMLHSIESYEELVTYESDYLNDILSETEQTSILTMVENPLIAGFLSEKIHEAESYAIKVKYQCVLSEDVLSVPEYKLVEMMGILIDNAIEATKETNCMAMEMNLGREENTLIFETANGYLDSNIDEISKLFEIGYSSKGKDRGIGLSKLKRMLDQEKGEIIVSKEVRDESPWIRFRIEIPMKINVK